MDWSAIIVGVLSLAGTLAGSYGGMKLTSYRIEQLEKKVEKHNSVIQRTFILEERMKETNRRISDLEEEVKV